MAAQSAPGWMRPAGIIAAGLAGFGALNHLMLGTGSGGTFEGALVATLLDPLVFLGIPLGWYWVTRTKRSSSLSGFGGESVASSPILKHSDSRPEWTPPPVMPAKKPLAEIAQTPETAGGAQAFAVLILLGLVAAVIGALVIVAPPSQTPASQASPSAVPNVASRHWSIGDTFNDVRAIEGQPDQAVNDKDRGRTIWHYNLSDRVAFDDDNRVIYFRNSTGKLKVTMGSRDSLPTRQEGKHFAFGSTMHDVLDAVGMPSEAFRDLNRDREEWIYPTSPSNAVRSVKFESGLVTGWRDSENNFVYEGNSDKKPPAANAPSNPSSVPTPPSVREQVATGEANRSVNEPKAPTWDDYRGAVTGTVVARQLGRDGLTQVRFLRSMSDVHYLERLPVFRRTTE